MTQFVRLPLHNDSDRTVLVNIDLIESVKDMRIAGSGVQFTRYKMASGDSIESGLTVIDFTRLINGIPVGNRLPNPSNI